MVENANRISSAVKNLMISHDGYNTLRGDGIGEGGILRRKRS